MKEYDKVFREQEKAWIIERVNSEQIEEGNGKVHFLPHHTVVRKQAGTTKVQIVFDAL